jgi:hypothetical protein
MFISFEILEKLIKKGYNIKSFHVQDVIKWLIEEKEILITPYSQSLESFQYRITNKHQQLKDGYHAEDFASYDECILNAIEYVVNNMI